MSVHTCKCGEEVEFADENTQCSLCYRTGCFTLTKITCRQCHGDKTFWFNEGKEWCTLCDEDGMVEV